MPEIILDDKIKNIFVENRKCIINTDLDGILAGMLLQKFLHWEVVGYSSCCGKGDDELWLKDAAENLSECVFVDLPVCISGYSVIDQHYVAYDRPFVAKYDSDRNKVNPNILRRLYECGNYINKYPFGTAHFVLAVLENLNYIDENYVFDFSKAIGGFDLADLVFRADCVMGNTCKYTQNCFDWSDWLMNIGKKNTKTLFSIAKTEYKSRMETQRKVEEKLSSLGCKGTDGDCSNLFKWKDYTKIKEYMRFLEDALEIPKIPCFDIFNYGKLEGDRLPVPNSSFESLKNKCEKDNVFSYAFVSKKLLSLTYLKE